MVESVGATFPRMVSSPLRSIFILTGMEVTSEAKVSVLFVAYTDFSGARMQQIVNLVLA
jgi:hypothetical protein